MSEAYQNLDTDGSAGHGVAPAPYPPSVQLAAPAVIHVEGVQVGQQAHGGERSPARPPARGRAAPGALSRTSAAASAARRRRPRASSSTM
jgi:hypothetical protein